jgi:hypothetical protein
MRRRGGLTVLCASALVMTAGAAAPAAATAAPRASASSNVVRLQNAAADLVRETSYKDKEGSARAVSAFTAALNAAKTDLATKAADEAAKITVALGEVKDALAAGDFAQASAAAREVRDAVDEAAAKVGATAAPTRGLAKTMASLKAAARDLDQEARNGDKAGSKRAYTAFKAAFADGGSKLKAKSARSYRSIDRARAAVGKALTSGNMTRLRAQTKALVTAVNAAAAAVGAR